MRRLLVFAKQPVPGRVKTRLAAALGNEGACDLYRAFVADTAALADRLAHTEVTWWLDGDPEAFDGLLGHGRRVRVQPGGDLGARLAFAFDAAFGAGAGPAVVLGTDSPHLPPARLEEVFTRLEQGADAAAVPAEDGGFVALGLAAPCLAAFSGIHWSAPSTLDEVEGALLRAGRRLERLETGYDLDELASLSRLLAETSCAPGPAPRTVEAAGRLTSLLDDLGRPVALAPRPERVVSLVPSVTECLFDAGLGTRVVGRTRFCISPPEVSSVASVGGPKTFDPSRVRALSPDLVLANAEENDRARVEELARAGLRVHVAFPTTVPQVAALLRQLGLLFGHVPPFERFASQLERAARPGAPPKVRCACLIWKKPYMTASGDTLTSALLEAAGGENVFAAGGENRYPVVPLETLARAAPRVVLLPSEPYAFGEDDARELEEALPGTTALCLPGEWVTWYGSRTAAAVVELRRLLDRYRTPETP